MRSLRMIRGKSLGLLAGKRVGQGLLRCVSRNKVGLDVDIVLLGLADMGAPRSNLLVMSLADNKNDSAGNHEDPTNPSEDDRCDDTAAVSVVENNLSILRDQSVSIGCADTSNVCVSGSDDDSHGDTTGEMDKDTSNSRKLPAKSNTMILVSLRPDQVEEESTTKDGSDIDSCKDVVGCDTDIVVVVFVCARAMRLNVLLLADIS